ncbi:MAG: hypothetical protein VYA30_11790 [Myxococcota bacterium]|nr:hypothetical protein [Myxococcota bacterium]
MMSNVRTAATLMASIFAASATIGCGDMSEDFVGANYAPSQEAVHVDVTRFVGTDALSVNALDIDLAASHVELDDVDPSQNDIDLHGRFDQYEFDFAAIDILETDELADDGEQVESSPGLGDGYGNRREWKDVMSNVCAKLGGELSANTFGPEHGGRGHNAVSFYCSFSEEFEVKYTSFVIGGEGSCKSNETLTDWAEEVCESRANIVLHKGYGDCEGDKFNPYHSAMLFVCKSL